MLLLRFTQKDFNNAVSLVTIPLNEESEKYFYDLFFLLLVGLCQNRNALNKGANQTPKKVALSFHSPTMIAHFYEKTFRTRDCSETLKKLRERLGEIVNTFS